MQKVTIPYSQVKRLIEEGDVLLFRGTGIFSRFIQRAGEGKYSHVGVASWHNGGDLLECIEFVGGSGGRSVNLDTYVEQINCQIDVFRPIPRFSKWVFEPKKRITELEMVKFQGVKVTRCMRKLTGLPYGWRRIWWIFKHKLPILRFFYNLDSITIDGDGNEEVIYPVCATSISHCFSKNGYDLVYHRSDEWTEPSDLARSTRLNYLFTIGDEDD